MQITLELPERLADTLTGETPARAALEAIAVEAYRLHRITGRQLREALGLASRFELDALLKRHQVAKYTVEDFEQDLLANGQA